MNYSGTPLIRSLMYFFILCIISYHHNLLPSSFHDLFLSSNQVHQYETRLASQYRPHFCRTNIKQFSILYRGPKIWNSLPISLISSPSIFVFKINLKNYLTDSRSVAYFSDPAHSGLGHEFSSVGS